MKRNIITEAIILRTTPFGEIHKNVTMFTRDHGILNAIAYGALKSTGKLRSIASPFVSGIVYLYNEPVKGSWKITDMDIRDFSSAFRENLRKYYSASLWAELVLFSHGGGEDSGEMYDFFIDAFRLLSASVSEPGTTFCTIQFIWHYLHFLGIRPATDTCARCENPIADTGGISYSRREGGFVCDDCRDEIDQRLNPGSRKYLEYTADRPFQEAIKIRLAQDAASVLKRLMFSLAEAALDHPLNTLKSGEGIL